jgi:hypothetical protein
LCDRRVEKLNDATHNMGLSNSVKYNRTHNKGNLLLLIPCTKMSTIFDLFIEIPKAINHEQTIAVLRV